MSNAEDCQNIPKLTGATGRSSVSTATMREDLPMNTNVKLGLAMLAGFGLGAVGLTSFMPSRSRRPS